MSDYYDSGNESSNEEDDLEDDSGVLLALEPEPNQSSLADGLNYDDDYPHKVLSTEDVMKHMNESIKEVNTVVQVMMIIGRKFIYFYFNNKILPLATTNDNSYSTEPF